MNYEEIMQKYMARKNEAVAKEKELQAEAERLKAQAEKYARLMAVKTVQAEKKESEAWRARWQVTWTEQVRDIMQELTERTGIEWEDTELHTFGISCECPVWEKGHVPGGEPKRYLLFYPSFGDDDRIMVWNGDKTNDFAPGTIGELNDGNYVKVPVESIEQLEQIMDKTCSR